MTNGERLRKIRRRASEIHKAHPGGSYQVALKKAGKEFREGAIGKRPKRKPAKKVPRKKRHKVSGVKYSGGSVSIGSPMTIAEHKRALCAELRNRIAVAMMNKELASTKTRKKEMAKKITELKKQYRAAEKL